MSLDNSSCNLASINLLKFLTEAGTFDVAKFTKLTELIITAMDISITFADFPTEKIAETTRDYRQLGIGYANLGALLMATGHAYDSEGGRSLAAAITSLMTGVAYKRSAEIAHAVGPYAGYARNAEAHKRVMRKHAAANDGIRTLDEMDKAVHAAAAKQWADCLKAREARLPQRAGQPARADRHHRPDDGLRHHRDRARPRADEVQKLVGGGSMQIVNHTVPRALEQLGYQQEQIEAIVEYIAEHGHVVDAPGLRPDHYEVFDCAMGERSISPMGHVRMMAAVQPFLSGAISKTVNMPEKATIEDIEKVYFEGWRLGLKAWRSTATTARSASPCRRRKKKEKEERGDAGPAPDPQAAAEAAPATVTRFSVAGAEGYMTASSYPDDGVGEVFLKLGKQGSTLVGVMDAFSMAISISLQYGVPLETWVEKFTNMRFEPAGMTDDPDIRMATSVMDYIFRRLALDHLPFEDRAELGILTAGERAMQANGRTRPPCTPRTRSTTSRSPSPPRSPSRPPRSDPAPEAHSSVEAIEAARAAPRTPRSASPAARRCARRAAATSAKAAAPPAAAADARPTGPGEHTLAGGRVVASGDLDLSSVVGLIGWVVEARRRWVDLRGYDQGVVLGAFGLGRRGGRRQLGGLRGAAGLLRGLQFGLAEDSTKLAASSSSSSAGPRRRLPMIHWSMVGRPRRRRRTRG